VGTTKAVLLSSVGEYSVHNLLAKGGSGRVFLGSNTKDGALVAVKVADKLGLSIACKALRMEAKILHRLKHKNIVRLLHAEENETRICLVLEYAHNGDLYSHMQRKGSRQPRCYEEVVARRLFRQLLAAVHHIHLKGYIHRDIKPENFLVSANETLLLCDFSLATSWSPLAMRRGACGTLHFTAPEVLLGSSYIGPDVDLWSCGAVLYFMLSGEKPFSSKTDFGVLRNMQRGKRKPLDKKLVSREARNLVNGLLHPDPLRRFTLQHILGHDWYSAKTHPVTRRHKRRSSARDQSPENRGSKSGNVRCRKRAAREPVHLQTIAE